MPAQRKMSEFLFRQAQLADESAVVALSAQIWEGEDYVADCFHDWVADPRGQFTVVYEGEELVAFGKLTESGPGEWWLEGLRVAPAHRGRGLARRLHEYAVTLADQIGWGVLRFMTASNNKAVHKLARESGFHRISQHWLADAALETAVIGDAAPFTLVEAAELPHLRTYLQQSATFAATHGLMEHDWVLLSILPRLAAWQQAQQLYWWRGSDTAFLIFSADAEEQTGWLSYLDAPLAVWPTLLADLAALALRLGLQNLHSKPLATEAGRVAFTAVGWNVDPDVQLWAYERPLAQRWPGQTYPEHNRRRPATTPIGETDE